MNTHGMTRRNFGRALAVSVAGLATRGALSFGAESNPIAAAVRTFINTCARKDGSYAPSPDPTYAGNSDTGASDLAAVTYAATLAKTMAWKLPHRSRSIDFIRKHQRSDGAFANHAGTMKPDSDLAILYNTVQGVVALRALGAKPSIDPVRVMDRFFAGDTFTKLPWYTTSFFPLFYAALDAPFPEHQKTALSRWQLDHQADDGYLGDHIAATFHLVHYLRLIQQPVPKADRMLARVISDQTLEGGWNIKEPDWDVHACFDAVYVLRQLGQANHLAQQAINRAAHWAMGCRTQDGGFGHYPGWHGDMDAVYFQFGTLIEAGITPPPRSLPDAHTLSWGHAMEPDVTYGRG